MNINLHWRDLSPSPLNALVRGSEAEAKADIEELATSIAQEGVIQPLTVTEMSDGYQIVTGERRWRATRSLGEDAPLLPCVVKEPMEEVDQLVVMGVENLQRRNLNPVVEARYYQALTERGLSVAQIAYRVGKSVPHIKGRLQALELAPVVQDHVETGRIPFTSVKHLADLPAEAQTQIADKVVGKNGKHIKRVVDLVKKRSGKTNGVVEPEPGMDLKAQNKFLRLLVSRLAAQVRLDAQVVMDCANRLAFYDDELAEPAFDHANKINEQIRSALSVKSD